MKIVCVIQVAFSFPKTVDKYNRYRKKKTTKMQKLMVPNIKPTTKKKDVISRTEK